MLLLKLQGSFNSVVISTEAILRNQARRPVSAWFTKKSKPQMAADGWHGKLWTG